MKAFMAGETDRLIDRSTREYNIYRQGSSRVYRIHPINGDPCLIHINYHKPALALRLGAKAQRPAH